MSLTQSPLATARTPAQPRGPSGFEAAALRPAAVSSHCSPGPELGAGGPVGRKGGTACGLVFFLLSPLPWLPDLPPPSTSAFRSLGNGGLSASGEDSKVAGETEARGRGASREGVAEAEGGWPF